MEAKQLAQHKDSHYCTQQTSIVSLLPAVLTSFLMGHSNCDLENKQLTCHTLLDLSLKYLGAAYDHWASTFATRLVKILVMFHATELNWPREEQESWFFLGVMYLSAESEGGGGFRMAVGKEFLETTLQSKWILEKLNQIP